MKEVINTNIPPDIMQNYINHSLRMKYHQKQELTSKSTFMFPLPVREDSYHEPFIELPFEYVAHIAERTHKDHQILEIISYKSMCACGDAIYIFETAPRKFLDE